jgi:hypothetical protein
LQQPSLQRQQRLYQRGVRTEATAAVLRAHPHAPPLLPVVCRRPQAAPSQQLRFLAAVVVLAAACVHLPALQLGGVEAVACALF